MPASARVSARTSATLTGLPRALASVARVIPRLVTPPGSLGWSTKPPSRAQSSYKSHPYSSRYHSSNVWMWFFFAMYIAEDDDPDEEEFEGWLEDQDEDDLTAAEQQYTEEVEGC